MNTDCLLLRRTPAAVLLLLLALLAAACAKKNEVAPTVPTTGQLAGTLAPVGAATAVTATAADGRRYSTTPDPATGAFAFPDLAPGTYYLGATTTARYNPPTSQPIAVQAGRTATANLSLSRSSRILGLFTWKLNGQPHTADLLSGTISGNTFFVYAHDTLAGGRSHNVLLALSSLMPNGFYSFTGAGTYPLGLLPRTIGRYTYNVPTGSTDYTTATATSQVGQVVVTNFNPTARAVSGTFAFVATADPAGTVPATQTISDGYFSLSY